MHSFGNIFEQQLICFSKNLHNLSAKFWRHVVVSKPLVKITILLDLSSIKAILVEKSLVKLNNPKPTEYAFIQPHCHGEDVTQDQL